MQTTNEPHALLTDELGEPVIEELTTGPEPVAATSPTPTTAPPPGPH